MQSLQRYKEIRIREFEEQDIENKIKWINNPENHAFLHYSLPLEYDKTVHWFYNKDKKSRKDCVIEYNGIPVGLIGLLNIDDINQKAEYYVSMGEVAYKGKGIATEASYLILEYAFEELHLNKVYLNVDYENVIARKMYEKVGFKEEGLFKEDLWHHGKLIDRVRFAYFKRDWVERNTR